MKIAVVTIYDFFNHGNRLQNYALEQSLKKLGHEVETLAITPKRVYSFFLGIARILPFISIISRMNKSKKDTKNWSKTRIIDSYSHKKLAELAKGFDAVVIGSDQVWNPSYMIDKHVSFLKFADSEKCLSFAPSFGIEELQPALVEDYKNGLSHIKSLSVRENEGAKLIKELVGIDAPVVVDPTLLLSKEEWKKFSQKVENKPEKYILTYFLGAAKQYKQRANEIAKENGLKVVHINNMSDKFFKADPKEFIDLMNNAELICTNSFHGHALSIVLEKPFVSFASFSKTKSRVNTLLKNMKLENRNFQTVKKEEVFQVDFSYSREKILAEKEKSLKFLKNALDEVKSKAGEK